MYVRTQRLANTSTHHGYVLKVTSGYVNEQGRGVVLWHTIQC